MKKENVYNEPGYFPKEMLDKWKKKMEQKKKNTGKTVKAK